MKTKKRTHAQLLRENATKSKDQIMRLFRMSEQHYNDTLFQLAYDYLEYIGWDDPVVVSTITQSSIFWEWWVSQYGLNDEIFLVTIKDNPELISESTQYLIASYKSQHVECKFRPSSDIVRRILKENKQKQSNELITNRYEAK